MRKTLAVAAAALLPFAIVACGDDDDDDPGGSTPAGDITTPGAVTEPAGATTVP